MAAAASAIFAALVRARARAYARGSLGVARLPVAVVSVGNLSLGGSGKTPTVIALGRELQARGIKFDVLSRGYRRGGSKLAIAQTGAEPLADVGDEPALIARSLQVPVLVHPDRFRAGLEGERRFNSRLHLLDDGFQHWQLARQFDLVLVSAADLADRLLPAGRLRELPDALGRASALLWVGEWSDPAKELAVAKAALGRYSSSPVFVARRVVLGERPPDLPYYALCGLARPQSFWNTLEAMGLRVLGRRAFRDHHRYRGRDWRHLEQARRACGATTFITTAKDALKVPLGFGPVHVVEIQMDIPELAVLTGLILKACGQ